MNANRSNLARPGTAAGTGAKASATRAARRTRKASAPTPAPAPGASAPRAAAAAKLKQAKPTAAAKTPKAKAKLVRDSFTMPEADFALVALLKDRALDFKRPTKKSELLRAGLHALAALDSKALRSALEALAPLKPGRPKKSD